MLPSLEGELFTNDFNKLVRNRLLKFLKLNYCEGCKTIELAHIIFLKCSIPTSKFNYGLVKASSLATTADE